MIENHTPEGAIAPVDSSHNGDWVLHAGEQQGGIERIEAYFHGVAYSPHRHDTYAIGQTLWGVQSFHYEGCLTHSQAGMTLVLHPDELHDGHAGTEEGFQYRMAYIEPALFQDVLAGAPLPFIKGGLSSDPRLLKASAALLRGMDEEIEPLELDDAIYDLAIALQSAAGPTPKGGRTIDYHSAERARQYINDTQKDRITLAELETASGRDRWSLSRDFRACFGTSPYRYLTMRRLDTAKRMIAEGYALADTAAATGFADQSHMTRHFSKAFGISPSRWARMLKDISPGSNAKPH